MRRRGSVTIACAAIFAAMQFGGDLGPGRADEPPAADDASAGGSTWTKSLADRTRRGTLHDAALAVRGDTGRWNDAEMWLHAPTPAQTSARLALDDWLEQWSAKKYESTEADGHWLLLRTRQLNDNDRLWVDRIERTGNRITVYVNQAAWRGKYSKNFTYYQVFGVNVGKLEPGEYEATCILQPLTFTTFDGTGKPQDNAAGKPQINWPKDEKPADGNPLELSVKLVVAKSSR
jgi:hypothetical protein